MALIEIRVCIDQAKTKKTVTTTKDDKKKTVTRTREKKVYSLAGQKFDVPEEVSASVASRFLLLRSFGKLVSVPDCVFFLFMYTEGAIENIL